MKKPPDDWPVPSTRETDSRRTEAGAPKPGPLAGALRIADLFTLAGSPAVALDHLRRTDRAARLVIGGNLEAHALDRDRLERLRVSAARQADQARELQRKLAQSEAGDVLRGELALLIEFFEGALAEIERQLGPIH